MTHALCFQSSGNDALHLLHRKETEDQNGELLKSSKWFRAGAEFTWLPPSQCLEKFLFLPRCPGWVSRLSYELICFLALSHKMQETGSTWNTNVTLTDLMFGSPRSGHASLWSVPGWLLSMSSHRLSFLKAFVCLRFYYFSFPYLCVGVCMGAQMSGEAGRGCQLSLGLQAIVGHLAWMLGT